MRGRDSTTKDLFDWQPPRVAVGYEDAVTGRGALDNQIARLVGRALRDARDAGTYRCEIAKAMGEYLGRQITEATLDKWAAESAEGHRIPLDAFIALIATTKAHDLLGYVPGKFSYAVVPDHYVELIELQQLEDHERAIASRKSALQAKLRGRK